VTFYCYIEYQNNDLTELIIKQNKIGNLRHYRSTKQPSFHGHYLKPKQSKINDGDPKSRIQIQLHMLRDFSEKNGIYELTYNGPVGFQIRVHIQ